MAKLNKTIAFDDGVTAVHFIAVSNVPGFSHKVLITKVGDRVVLKTYWMTQQFSACQKTAQFFLSKYTALVAERIA